MEARSTANELLLLHLVSGENATERRKRGLVRSFVRSFSILSLFPVAQFAKRRPSGVQAASRRRPSVFSRWRRLGYPSRPHPQGTLRLSTVPSTFSSSSSFRRGRRKVCLADNWRVPAPYTHARSGAGGRWRPLVERAAPFPAKSTFTNVE